MIKVGTLLNFLCVAVTAILLPAIGVPAYDLNTYPDWAKTSDWYASQNVTTDPVLTTMGMNITT